MPQPKPQNIYPSVAPRQAGAGTAVANPATMAGLIDAVLVEDAGEFTFDGAIRRGEAEAVWTWLGRDVAPDLLDSVQLAPSPGQALAAALPSLLGRARAALANAIPGSDAERRLRSQLGSVETWQRLPAVLSAMKCSPLLDRAQAFGRAINTIQDEEAPAAALQSMPRQDASVAALLMMAAAGQVVQPSRLAASAVRITGTAAEMKLVSAGFGPLLDALLAQAQNAIPPMREIGPFADMDKVCRAVERFHRLMRAIDIHVDLARPGRRAGIVAALTKTVSGQLEPRLRDLVADIGLSLRRPREGIDRVDSERLLSALNGIYLLAVVRDCRDSLALNEVFDEAWTRSGQTLELHLNRAIDALRDAPGDRNVAGRLDAGIKMAEVRFGADYADILRRARDGIERRVSPPC